MHIRVWRRVKRGVARARERLTKGRGKTTAEVKARLVTGSEGITWANQREVDKRDERLGWHFSLDDKETSIDSARKREAERDFQKVRDAAERDELVEKLLPPGIWRCCACNTSNFPDYAKCMGHTRTKVCNGSQSTTWGGYAVSPKRKTRLRIEARRSERCRASKIRQQAQAKEKVVPAITPMKHVLHKPELQRGEHFSTPGTRLFIRRSCRKTTTHGIAITAP